MDKQIAVDEEFDQAVETQESKMMDDLKAEQAVAEARVFGEMAIDTKYEFLAWKRGSGMNGPTFGDEEAIVFRAKDDALLPTLRFYQDECARIGASEEQLMAIGLLIMRVEKWREQNPEDGNLLGDRG